MNSFGYRPEAIALKSRIGSPISPYHSNRDAVEAGGLMSYGTDTVSMFHQAGLYTGQILKGAKPADLPVLQSTKFEFVINLQTARALGLEVPNSIQLLADEVIE
jgi:putative tryptophan/tyrosine transport system substrate-binding protein